MKRHNDAHSPMEKAKYQKLIGMMDAFASGQTRSRDFVSQMEGEFATSDLDEDERFQDLQLALATFGAADHEADEKILASECKYALRLLRQENVTNPTTVYDKTTSIEYIGAKFPHLIERLHEETWEGLLHLQMGVFAQQAQDSIDSGDRQLWKHITEVFMDLWRACAPDVTNALNVSFLEHLNFTDDKKPRSWAYTAMPDEMRKAWDEMEAYNRKLEAHKRKPHGG